jgi:hypothetical protein
VASRWTESDSRFVRIIATGFTNPRVDELGNLVASPASARRSLVAIARERIYDYDVKQAVLLSDPNAQLEVTGNDFQILGQDVNYSDGQPGTDGGRPGLAVTGLPNAIISQLALAQCSHIQGLGGTPSIVQRLVGSDLVDKLIAYYHSSASIRFGPDAHYMGGNLGDIANDAFVVTYATGDLTCSHQTHGAGMLLVTGDLIVDGSFQFTGIVAVRGRVVVTGSGPQDQKTITGTLLVGDDLNANVNASSNGSLTIQYSSEATAKAKRRAGRYSIEAIMQGS